MGKGRDVISVLSKECVISSVPSPRGKNVKWWTSVAARLQLSFIWQAKENISSRHEGRFIKRERGPQFWLLFSYVVFSSP